jgi:hypothetical protein
VETVSMAKTCNFDSNISDFNSVKKLRPKNDQRSKKFSKTKFEVQRPRISNFMIIS